MNKMQEIDAIVKRVNEPLRLNLILDTSGLKLTAELVNKITIAVANKTSFALANEDGSMVLFVKNNCMVHVQDGKLSIVKLDDHASLLKAIQVAIVAHRTFKEIHEALSYDEIFKLNRVIEKRHPELC